jgi:flagellar motor component MotA
MWLVFALLNTAEVLGALGIVAGLVGLVLVAGRLSEEVDQVGQDMVDLFTQGH